MTMSSLLSVVAIELFVVVTDEVVTAVVAADVGLPLLLPPPPPPQPGRTKRVRSRISMLPDFIDAHSRWD